jgi:hypothetical protein
MTCHDSSGNLLTAQHNATFRAKTVSKCSILLHIDVLPLLIAFFGIFGITAESLDFTVFPVDNE